MKINFFTHTAKCGGAEFSLIDLIRVAECEKKKVTLLDSGDLVAKLKSFDAEVNEFHRGNGYFEFIRKLFYLKTSFKGYDIVYSNSNRAYLWALLVKLLFFKRFKLIWHLRDAMDGNHFGIIRYPVCLSSRLTGVFVVFNSEYTRSAFRSSFGKDGLVIYNGFDMKNFSTNEVSNQSSPYKIAMISRISPWKGQKEVIKAVANLDFNVEVLVCGAPLFGEDEYYNEICREVEILNLKDKVKFLGNVSNVPKFLAETDINLVIHASTLPEPFGRCVVEAMLTGIPVMASNLGGVPEIANKDSFAYLFDPLEPNDLERGLKFCVSSQQSLMAKAKQADKECRNKFSYENLRESINVFLRNVYEN
tara:strand:+ start:6282 stop:7367 length:1086 start_codon:yes stop_codon:yes gene_type:complete